MSIRNFICFFKQERNTYQRYDGNNSDEEEEYQGRTELEIKKRLEEKYGPDKFHLQKLKSLELQSLIHLDYGGFSSVKKGYSKSCNAEVAVKIIKEEEDIRRYWDNILPIEIQLWKELSLDNHVNVLKLISDIRIDGFCYLISELADRGNLNDLLRGGRVSEYKAKSLFKDIISAVEYCHNKGIAHRDIKAENLLVGENDKLKLADFSFVTKDNPCSRSVGTPGMIAPEQAVTMAMYDPFISDIWQVGLTLYFMLFHETPYKSCKRRSIEFQIAQNKEPGRVLFEHVFYPRTRPISTELKTLIGGMLEVETRNRWRVSVIKECPWMTTRRKSATTVKSLTSSAANSRTTMNLHNNSNEISTVAMLNDKSSKETTEVSHLRHLEKGNSTKSFDGNSKANSTESFDINSKGNSNISCHGDETISSGRFCSLL